MKTSLHAQSGFENGYNLLWAHFLICQEGQNHTIRKEPADNMSTKTVH